VGFFPFQSQAFGVGKPVGGTLSDYHGAIVDPELEWDAARLVRACGLQAWDFHHLIASQRPFRTYHARTAGSPYMDLSRGFEAYRRARSASGSKAVAQAERKARKLEREIGPVRFSSDNPDLGALHALLRWKSPQYRRSGVTDILASRWRLELLERLLATRRPRLTGMLSTLHVRDRLVAAHIGLRAEHALHWWLPAYDPDYARYSPGLILLVQLARSADREGFSVIDLGKGDELYKSRFMTGAVTVAEGSVVASDSLAHARRVAGAVKDRVAGTAVAPLAREGVRRLRRRLDERRAA
jgi:CelD/BcsL family acetyltransferase involved in cellulose biosynthesis